jgi:hypothetical protein
MLVLKKDKSDDEILDELLMELHPSSFKDKIRCIIVKNIPHPTPSHEWFLPIWWVFFFGGTYDNGNGSTSKPNLYRRIKHYIKIRKLKKEEYKYWQEYYNKYGCESGPCVKASYDGGKTYVKAEKL